MNNFKLTIEYDGTNYWGWQIQNQRSKAKNQKFKIRTVQGEIEKALNKLFGKNIRLIGSGRTDRGVHALGQVANFKYRTELKPLNIKNALNSYLPPDIRVIKVEKVKDDFHARFSAKSKVYRYFILNYPRTSVFYRNYSWWVKERINLKLMRKAMQMFLGRHNFKAFTSHNPKRKSDNFVRTVKRVSLRKKRNFLIFDIEADGFLYNMVRNIVGVLIEVGKGKISVSKFKKIFYSKDRRLVPSPAPPQGLFLVKVKY